MDLRDYPSFRHRVVAPKARYIDPENDKPEIARIMVQRRVMNRNSDGSIGIDYKDWKWLDGEFVNQEFWNPKTKTCPTCGHVTGGRRER